MDFRYWKIYGQPRTERNSNLDLAKLMEVYPIYVQPTELMISSQAIEQFTVLSQFLGVLKLR